MNQSSLEGSLSRYSKKRKSTDAVKTSLPAKNPKKSLPEVFIDLNNHTKKTKLALDPKPARPREDSHNFAEVSTFNDGRGAERNRKLGKKENILLKNLYNTEAVRRNDENKNILNEYRDEIELLKMDNERLREENEKLRAAQEYLQRRLREEKTEKLREVEELTLMHAETEERLQDYEQKIKSLYEQLIRCKRARYGREGREGREEGEGREGEGAESEEQVVLSTLNSENNRGRLRGEVQSHREKDKYAQLDLDIDKYKRLTSPSSHSRPHDKGLSRWCDEQRDYLRRHEDKGEVAYYRAERLRETGRNSVLENAQYS